MSSYSYLYLFVIEDINTYACLHSLESKIKGNDVLYFTGTQSFVEGEGEREK